MEPAFHRLSDLFRQLGLADDPAAIEAFIQHHRPLAPGVALAEAPFWTPSQARFLCEEWEEDADWSASVDLLGSLLSVAG